MGRVQRMDVVRRESSLLFLCFDFLLVQLDFDLKFPRPARVEEVLFKVGLEDRKAQRGYPAHGLVLGPKQLDALVEEQLDLISRLEQVLDLLQGHFGDQRGNLAQFLITIKWIDFLQLLSDLLFCPEELDSIDDCHYCLFDYLSLEKRKNFLKHNSLFFREVLFG